jgi:hypothetical protein
MILSKENIYKSLEKQKTFRKFRKLKKKEQKTALRK